MTFAPLEPGSPLESILGGGPLQAVGSEGGAPSQGIQQILSDLADRLGNVITQVIEKTGLSSYFENAADSVLSRLPQRSHGGPDHGPGHNHRQSGPAHRRS